MRASSMRLLGILALAVGCGLAAACLIPPASAAPPQQNPSGSSLQADALKAYRQNRFDDVVRLLEAAGAR